MKYWDKAWSLVEGCTPCSPGCDHCWLTGMAHRFKTLGAFTGAVVTRADRFEIPLRNCRKPNVYAIWSDLFHEKVDRYFIMRAFDVMSNSRLLGHKFLVLTKRAERMARWFEWSQRRPNDHIWTGVTICNEDEIPKIQHLLKVPGNRWLSIEPLLGPIDLKLTCPSGYCQAYTDAECPGNNGACIMRPPIHAVVVGGESGPGARLMHPDWVRSIRDQCAEAGVPFIFKRWGTHAERIYYLMEKGDRMLDGRTHDDLPWRMK